MAGTARRKSEQTRLEEDLEDLRIGLQRAADNDFSDTPAEKAALDHVGQAGFERMSAVASLHHVIVFFTCRGMNVGALSRLKDALWWLIQGNAPSAMLEPTKRTGRKPVSEQIEFYRGCLAGFAFILRWSEEPPNDAAKWIAGRSRGLTFRISLKPITARMIRKWLDLYGRMRTARTPADWLTLMGNAYGSERRLGYVYGSEPGERGFGIIVSVTCQMLVDGETLSVEDVKAELKKLEREILSLPLLR